MPQIGSNIYAIGMITALRDYVRLLRAILLLTPHPIVRFVLLLLYKRQIRVIKRPLTGYTHIVRVANETSVLKIILASSFACSHFFNLYYSYLSCMSLSALTRD